MVNTRSSTEDVAASMDGVVAGSIETPDAERDTSANPIPTSTNEAIAVSFRKPDAANKPRKPTTTRKRARKDVEANGDATHDRIFEFTGGNGARGTWFEELTWLIAELKQTITTQSRTIELLKESQDGLKQIVEGGRGAGHASDGDSQDGAWGRAS
jgi:hypothetical protein